VRLDLERLVKARKDEIRARIVLDAQRALAKHMTQLAAETEPYALPPVAADFAGAIKGKRSLAAMHDAVDAALAAAKIAADAAARVVRTNAAFFCDAARGHETVFPDVSRHIGMAHDAFREFVSGRLARHAAEEAERAKRAAEAAAAAAPPTPVPTTPVHPEEPYQEARGDFQAVQDEGAALSLGDINARLGITMTGAFVATILGITPAGRARRALWFTDQQFAAVCQQLIAHVEAARVRHRVAGTVKGME
jgi:hypothetical protein